MPPDLVWYQDKNKHTNPQKKCSIYELHWVYVVWMLKYSKKKKQKKIQSNTKVGHFLFLFYTNLVENI